MLILLYVAIGLACLFILNRWLAPLRRLGPSEVEDFERDVLEEVRRMAVEGFEVSGLGRQYLWLLGHETTAIPPPPADPFLVGIRIVFQLHDQPREASKALEPAARHVLDHGNGIGTYDFVFPSNVTIKKALHELEEFVDTFATLKPPPFPSDAKFKNLE